jgi:hypothetical protein
VARAGFIKMYLKKWLSQFDKPEFWADYDIIDKPMLIDLITSWDKQEVIPNLPHNQIFADALNQVLKGGYKIGLPKHLPNINYYDFYDLHTIFLLKGINPDINREEFVKEELNQMVENTDYNNLPIPFSALGEKHTALYDAYVSYLCYENLMRL